MMKITIDEKFPLFALDECQTHLQLLSTMFCGFRNDLCLNDDDFAGLSSMVGLLAGTVKEVSRVLHERQEEERRPQAAPVAPSLTEPRGRKGVRHAAA